MDTEKYTELMNKLINHMLKRLEECEPEQVTEYVCVIVNLADNIHALGRKLNV